MARVSRKCQFVVDKAFPDREESQEEGGKTAGQAGVGTGYRRGFSDRPT